MKEPVFTDQLKEILLPFVTAAEIFRVHERELLE